MMQKMRAGAFAAIVAAIAGLSTAAAEDQSVSSTNTLAADTGYFQKIVPVADGVWLLAEPKFQAQPIGNVTVIEQSDGLVVVDSGGSPGSGRRIVQMIRSLSPKPVKAIFISQWHGDKVQGLSELLKAWPHARSIATKATQAHLSDPKTMNTPGSPNAERNSKFIKDQQNLAAYMKDLAGKATDPADRDGYAAAARMFDQYALDVDGALTIPTAESFTDTLKIDDIKAPVEALFLGRANTDGDAVIWLPRQKIIVAGETVILPFPYGFESYPADWIDVLKKLRAMPFEVLLPGHGQPQHDRQQIDRIIAALEDVRAQVGQLVSQGLGLDEIQGKIDLSAQQRTFVGDDPWGGRWFKEFWTKPIVESAYKEAKGIPIVQGFSALAQR